SIENNFLYQSIERLFEGFVNASVTAIESRDPTTSGHSSRVAILTERLAKTVDKVKTGFLANIRFTKEQLKEIRYASLLHDFGKVGVRENVLLKAKKLYPHQSTEVLYRIGFLKKSEEIKNLRKQIRFLLDYGSSNYQLVFNELESELRNKLDDLDNISNLISNLNEPTVMETDKAESLEELAVLKFFDFDNEERNLLKPEEVKALSIKRGSLDDEERIEIESHVTHTFRFLKEVPWTKEFQNIPDIAHAHHEKLDGSGYPNKLTSESIPVQSKIMTISDIFDALTASDRPYKKAVPYERALDILQFEVNDNHVEPEILKVFIDAKVYTSVIKSG
ncbi:HD family phosphohydrolase, partial [candidate division KSB1 bacterium]|nr:HD family phosphohydrolase [candidate division KSB1 bacterium]